MKVKCLEHYDKEAELPEISELYPLPPTMREEIQRQV